VEHIVHSGASRERNIQALFFHAEVGVVQIPHKARWDTLCRTSIFASGRICGSHSAFRCVRGSESLHTLFHARVGPVRFP
jgi:hypothetical protein